MEFLTVKPAAKAVGLPLTQFRAMIDRGEIPGFYASDKNTKSNHRPRFYVNMELLREMLERKSIGSVSSGNAE